MNNDLHTMQILFDIVAGLAAFLGGWVLNNITKAVDRLDRDVRQMPVNYVSKEDHRDSMARIENLLERIDHKLDAKVDKH